MSRRRYISTRISQDARVNKLALLHGDFAALLYTWLIPHAADDGTLPGDPEELLYHVLPGRRDKTTEDVRVALDAMASLKLIQFTEDGRVAFPTETFYRYQSYIKERNKRGGNAPEPAHNSAPPELDGDISANQRKSAQNAVSFPSSFPVSFSPPVSTSPLTPPEPPEVPVAPQPEVDGDLEQVPIPLNRGGAARRKHEQTFDAFWAIYPKKEGKAKALVAWMRIKPGAETVRIIMEAIPKHERVKGWAREGMRYCPWPATWLNERRWEDELHDEVAHEVNGASHRPTSNRDGTGGGAGTRSQGQGGRGAAPYPGGAGGHRTYRDSDLWSDDFRPKG